MEWDPTHKMSLLLEHFFTRDCFQLSRKKNEFGVSFFLFMSPNFSTVSFPIDYLLWVFFRAVCSGLFYPDMHWLGSIACLKCSINESRSAPGIIFRVVCVCRVVFVFVQPKKKSIHFQQSLLIEISLQFFFALLFGSSAPALAIYQHFSAVQFLANSLCAVHALQRVCSFGFFSVVQLNFV